MEKVRAFIVLKEGILYHAGGKEINNPEEYCEKSAKEGVREFVFLDNFSNEDGHLKNLEFIKKISANNLYSFIVGGKCSHIDDVKKYLYTGASGMFFYGDTKEELLKESISRFKSERTGIMPQTKEDIENAKAVGIKNFYFEDGSSIFTDLKLADDENAIRLYDTETLKILKKPVFKSCFKWEELKLNSDGLIPVVVQDWVNNDVLMMAYMNKESFEKTLQTGLMTYYSRSRKSLWLKGETSGHFQYVKTLKLDCDNDTILAKVIQTGAACHTGNRTCFYRNIVDEISNKTTSIKVLEDVYNTIIDRKMNPVDGSYTNYLFDKGIDKILKKVGEEATEIVIAAKNPKSEEVVYEFGDFLYHMMVLMAEKNITWEDVSNELADRE